LKYHCKVRLLGYPPHLLVAGYNELLGFAGCVISALFVMIRTGMAYRRLFHAAGRFCENQFEACELSASKTCVVVAFC